jgi:membrane protein DedA with SNARE-associated domain
MELFSLEAIQSLAHQYGYWTVFLGIMLENAGIPLPGETITLVGGFLAGSGELKYGYVLVAAIAGAVLGDNVGYWIGRYGGWPLVLKFGKTFRIPESQMESARSRFSKNAPLAVFLGRFVALLRIFAGPLAGLAHMPYRQFLLCNTAGAAIWALATVSITYFVGTLVPLEVLMGWIARFTVLALVLVLAALFVTSWLERKHKLKLEK